MSLLRDQIAVSALLANLCLVAVIPAQGAPLPNIVQIMCDDLGWGDVGFNGNSVIHTPQLDEMARSGIVFTRFYAAAPVCSPTRGASLTGRHPYRYGILSANVGHMLPRELTVAEILQEAGYTTGHFGKWHLGTMTKTQRDSNRGGPRGAEHYSPPQDNGFDVCFSTEAKVPTWDPLIKPKGAKGNWWAPLAEGVDSEAVDDEGVDDEAVDDEGVDDEGVDDEGDNVEEYGTSYWNERGERVTNNVSGDDSRVIIDRVVPFIESAAREQKPFYAVVWYHAPHLPVVAGPKYTAMYPESDPYEAHYFGCITAMDEQLGRLRSTLRRLGIADNTLVTFCSDNGPEGASRKVAGAGKGAPGSAGPFRGRKRDLYEGGIRVPAIIEWPTRISAGSRTDFPAVTSDYVPTFLEAIGKPLPSDRQFDGVSLIPVLQLRGTEHLRSRPIAFEFAGKSALIDNRFKLIRCPHGAKQGNTAILPTGTGQYELYDIIADPEESNDIAADHRDIVDHMSEQLARWQAECQHDLE